AEGVHDLMNQVFLVLAAEHVVGDGDRLLAIESIQFHGWAPYFAALAAGRTITSPPGAPGTAPRIAIRPRSASMRTTSRFIEVWLTAPMWPDIFLPGNTRPGVWRWPIEPGARCDSELPCVASPMVKWWRLIVP